MIGEADFVVGILPKAQGLTDNYFSRQTTFSKMKKSAIFMNIGRGSTVNEVDLVKALKTKRIAGAVLDVYAEEPLPASNDLWSCPNLLMTPHCAPNDREFMYRAFGVLAKNLKIFCEDGPEKLNNICDKEYGY